MRGSGNSAIRAARQKGTTALAWTSLGFAVVGGTLAAGTWLGRFIAAVLDVLPWGWLPPVLLAGGVIAVVIDLFLDGVPNSAAIWSALLIPSVASATPGKLGASIRDWTGQLLDAVNGALAEWLGTDSATGLAIGCIVAALVMARRVIRKSRAAGMAV